MFLIQTIKEKIKQLKEKNTRKDISKIFLYLDSNYF